MLCSSLKYFCGEDVCFFILKWETLDKDVKRENEKEKMKREKKKTIPHIKKGVMGHTNDLDFLMNFMNKRNHYKMDWDKS